jgi:predicted nucleic acid-binding protein
MEKIDSASPLVVCDAGPLIHLDELGALDLLSDFADVLVPEAVWREVLRHRPGALSHPSLTLRQISPTLLEPPELEALAQALTLHTGEWEALRVAIEYRPCLLLTDDTAARLAAGSLGITTHGTLGILIRAIRRQQRSKQEIIDTLQSLPTRSTLHLKRSLLDEVMAQVNRQC